jgi:hypothetical protein
MGTVEAAGTKNLVRKFLLERFTLGDFYKCKFLRCFKISKSSFTIVNCGFEISYALKFTIFRSPLNKICY